jgi:hypothetical protein
MAIKQQPAFSKEDFESAIINLRLSVSEVSRESGVPRHIVSHFRNYGDGLKPEQAAKLRDFFESNGVEFTDEEEAPAVKQLTGEQPPIQQSFTLPIILSDDGLTQRTALICRHFFIDERLTDEQIKEAGKRILESFGQAKQLMDVELVAESFADGYDKATDAKLRELWGHLARIGLVCLQLQDRVLIDQDRITANTVADGNKPKSKTLGDLLFVAYHDAVAGFSASTQTAETEEEEVKQS